jgi:hypothetical protein
LAVDGRAGNRSYFATLPGWSLGIYSLPAKPRGHFRLQIQIYLESYGDTG